MDGEWRMGEHAGHGGNILLLGALARRIGKQHTDIDEEVDGGGVARAKHIERGWEAGESARGACGGRRRRAARNNEVGDSVQVCTCQEDPSKLPEK